eukprot:492738-Pyramimonas_sp.AAC.1
MCLVSRAGPLYPSGALSFPHNGRIRIACVGFRLTAPIAQCSPYGRPTVHHSSSSSSSSSGDSGK